MAKNKLPEKCPVCGRNAQAEWADGDYVMARVYECGAEWDSETKFPLGFVSPCPKAMEIAVEYALLRDVRNALLDEIVAEYDADKEWDIACNTDSLSDEEFEMHAAKWQVAKNALTSARSAYVSALRRK